MPFSNLITLTAWKAENAAARLNFLNLGYGA